MNLEMKMYDREKIGIQKGREEEKREIALKMLKEDLPMEMIMKLSDLSQTEILKLKRNL